MTSATPEGPATSAHANGVAVGVQLTTPTVLTTTGSDLRVTTQESARLLVGYQGASALVGLRLDVQHAYQGMDSLGAPSSSTGRTAVLVGIAGRFPIGGSSSGRAEIVFDGGLSYGYAAVSLPEGSGDPPGVHRIVVDAGPAVRFWLASSFAFGFGAELVYDQQSSGDNSIHTTYLVSGLDLVGVF